MAFRICTDISKETRWMIDMQRDFPQVQDFLRANEIAVAYQDKHEINRRVINSLKLRNADLLDALDRLCDAIRLATHGSPSNLGVEVTNAWDQARAEIKKATQL